MSVLNRAPPIATQNIMLSQTHPRRLAIKNLGDFTTHIYCLRTIHQMCCSTFDLHSRAQQRRSRSAQSRRCFLSLAAYSVRALGCTIPAI